MECRRIKRELDGKKQIVWFGSYGKNQDGTAKFYDETNKNNNFGVDEEAVQDSITQKLSSLKGELWTNLTFGLPILDKLKSKVQVDIFVNRIITNTNHVKRIGSFESKMNGTTYTANIVVVSDYGDFDIII